MRSSHTQPNTHHVRDDLASRKQSHIRDSAFRPQGTRQGGSLNQPIDPELVKLEPVTGPGYDEALKAWARFRFVRAGWFTAAEAIDYID